MIKYKNNTINALGNINKLYYHGNAVYYGYGSEEKQPIIWLDYSSSITNYAAGYYWGNGYKFVARCYCDSSFNGDVGSFLMSDPLNDGVLKSPLEFTFYSRGFYIDYHFPTSTTSATVGQGDYDARILQSGVLSNYLNGQILLIEIENGVVTVKLESTGEQICRYTRSMSSQNWYDGLYEFAVSIRRGTSCPCHVSNIQVFNADNELVNDFKFVKNDGVTGAQELSLYDSVLNIKYENTTSNTPTYHFET